MAQSSQPTLDEGDTAVIRFWDDQTRESMGTQGEMEIPITIFNSERSLRVSQGRGQTLRGGGDGTYRLQMQADFRRVQGKLSKSAGSGKRKDVQAQGKQAQVLLPWSQGSVEQTPQRSPRPDRRRATT